MKAEINRAISILNHFKYMNDDIERILMLVQENQSFFNDPLPGDSTIKAAADKLEELVRAHNIKETP